MWQASGVSRCSVQSLSFPSVEWGVHPDPVLQNMMPRREPFPAALFCATAAPWRSFEEPDFCLLDTESGRHKIQLTCEARYQKNHPSLCLPLPGSCSHFRTHQRQRQRPQPTETAGANAQLSLLLLGNESQVSGLFVSQLQTSDTQREMDGNAPKYDNQSLGFTVPGYQPDSAHDFCLIPGYTPTQMSKVSPETGSYLPKGTQPDRDVSGSIRL